MKQVKLISILLSTLIFLIISSAIVMAKSSELEFRGAVTNIAIPDGDGVSAKRRSGAGGSARDQGAGQGIQQPIRAVLGRAGGLICSRDDR